LPPTPVLLAVLPYAEHSGTGHWRRYLLRHNGTYHWRVAGAASSSCVSSGRVSQYPTIDDCVQPLAMSLSARNGANAAAAAFPIPNWAKVTIKILLVPDTMPRRALPLALFGPRIDYGNQFSCTVDQPPHPPATSFQPITRLGYRRASSPPF
jgi:hypothetical protein